MFLKMPVWLQMWAPLAFLFLLGCQDQKLPVKPIPPAPEAVVSLDLQNYSYDPTPVVKKSAPEVVEIRIRTNPKSVSVYDEQATLLGSSEEAGTFTTHAIAGHKVHLHFQKDGYHSSSLELTPGGLIEIHYINLNKK